METVRVGHASKEHVLKVFHVDPNDATDSDGYRKYCLNSFPFLKLKLKFDDNGLGKVLTSGETLLEFSGNMQGIKTIDEHERWLRERVQDASSISIGSTGAEVLARFVRCGGGFGDSGGPNGIYCLIRCMQIHVDIDFGDEANADETRNLPGSPDYVTMSNLRIKKMSAISLGGVPGD
jgi:hypothetical protein